MKKRNVCGGKAKRSVSVSDAKIKEKWKMHLPDSFKGKSKVRFLPTKYGKLKILYNAKRAKTVKYVSSGCPFSSFRFRGKFPLGDYNIVANIYPFAKKHRLVVTKRHYPKPKLRDLKFVERLSRIIPETIILSLRGSGAGVPQHLHFQTFMEVMPISRAKGKRIFSNKGVVVERVNFPAYCIKLSGKNISKWLFRVLNKMNYPYNLLFRGGSVSIFPRTTIYPIKNSTWKFGATELGGLFVLRDKKCFDSINEKQACLWLKKSTIPSKKKINLFEKRVKLALGV